jgi:hypothetical protein
MSNKSNIKVNTSSTWRDHDLSFKKLIPDINPSVEKHICNIAINGKYLNIVGMSDKFSEEACVI